MRKNVTMIGLAVLVIAGLAGNAGAQVRFNEMLINVPGGADQGGEFIELISDTPNYSMNGLTMLFIEGDPGNSAGRIDAAYSLSGKGTGDNRLFLWRDAASVLSPAPDAATVVFVQDFAPDIENGSNTYLIVEGFSGVVGSDIDGDNDGVIDATFWTRVVDAVGFLDNGEIANGARQYASALGGVDITDYDPNPTTGFTPDGFVLTECGILSHDVLGLAPGPFFNDPDDTYFFPANGQTVDPSFVLTPGSPNIGINCPPPTCNPDINGDGNVDQGDVDCMISTAAGDPACLRTDLTIDPDINGDGNVDQGDVDALINIVGGAPC